MTSKALRIALLVATIAHSACSGDGTGSDGEAGGRAVPAKAWAAKVCGATAHWIGEIERLNAGLQKQLDGTSLDALRDSTVAYFDDILASTDRMIERVEAAGVPEVEGGRNASRHVLSGLQAALQALRDARERAAALATTDPDAFSEALRQIGEEVATSLSYVGASLASFRSPELDAVAQEVRRCRELAA